MALITAQEVITLSFTHVGTDTTYIKANHILVGELEFIKPAIGEDLYNVIAAGSLTGKNEILYTTYLKPALAHYIKWLILPDMNINTTTKGLMLNSSEFAQQASSAARSELATKTLGMAQALLSQGIKYIEHDDNIDYFTTYRTSEETKNSTKLIGGIIF